VADLLVRLARRPDLVARPDDEAGERYFIYDDQVGDYTPTGVMPDGRGVSQSVTSGDQPGRGFKCIQARYRLTDNDYAAVAFLLDGQWKPRRSVNLFEKLGAGPGDRIVLRFLARSPDGATAQFKIGGVEGDSIRFARVTPWTRLTPDYERYQIDLTGRDLDLSSVVAAFIWVLDRNHNARLEKPIVEIDLDDIYLTRLKESSARPSRGSEPGR
jgi:hypothetical protein